MALNASSRAAKAPVNPPLSFAFAEMAIRGATQLYDLQMNTLRALSETHAQTATAFGIPNWAEWFRNGSEESLRQAVRDAAEQVLANSRRTAEAVSQLQGQFRELMTAQGGAATQQWQKVVEQLGTQMAQSLEGVRSIAEEQSRRVVEETEARVEAIAMAMQEDASAASANGSEAGARDDDRSKGPGTAMQHANGARPRAASRQH